MRKRPSETGAAAVEFALVFPMLIILLAGIVDFGRAFHTQIILSNAAREGARIYAFEGDAANVQARAQAASPNRTVTASPGAQCGTVVVVPAASEPFTWIFLDDILTILPGGGSSLAQPQLSSTGHMECY
ncbi:hypothetical protein N802_18470 [Knoellia sinensis KCTC 19936]|uniref:TadE-like domain-containing protein n=1 Tax=Knoellia sinensis KCTC 19936 TaxID=1385520 RepID=A0A0A0J4T2_9MICO|nr:TadE family protein [Knoellia sinensis]KGN32350.1 hypothetical protein N802_18470 [Knoellia sinensis KCTC 19936]